MFDQPTPVAHMGDKADGSRRARTLCEADLVGPYRLIAPLARGAFGTVWEAADERDERAPHVAIKFLHPFLCESSEAVERLRREAQAITAIFHPNVVKVHSFERLDDGRPYIVMELLEGTNLYSHLRTSGALSPERALDVLDGICAALTATHALGIIHRDLKASNVLMVPEGDRQRAVLLDYGLAKILETDGPELTSSRATLGTPSAMSPEQIRSEPVTARSDVYALGALAHHLLTGEAAFSSASRPTILYMHLHSQRPRPSAIADVSPAFDKVIAKAMARDPNKRYPSAMAFLADFASAVRSSAPASTDGAVVARIRTRAASKPVVSSRMLGVYLDVDADPELLEDPSDELLEDIEAIADIVEPIMSAASFDISQRRGNSALFVKVVPADKERAERRRLLRLLAVIRSAVSTRPARAEGVHVRVAVDVVSGGVGDASAEQSILEAATRITRADGETRGTLGTARFFDQLGLATEENSEISELFRVANNSEL